MFSEGVTSGGYACVGLIAERVQSRPPKERKMTSECPWVLAVLNMCAISHDTTDHKWTTVTMNNNMTCKPHQYANHVGPTMILAVGDFEGGDVYVWNEGTKHKMNDVGKATKINVRTLQHFDGRKLHATEAFKGWRVSFVWYTQKRHQQAPETEIQTIKNMGCRPSRAIEGSMIMTAAVPEKKRRIIQGLTYLTQENAKKSTNE